MIVEIPVVDSIPRAIPHKDCTSDVLYEHKFRQMKQKAE